MNKEYEEKLNKKIELTNEEENLKRQKEVLLQKEKEIDEEIQKRYELLKEVEVKRVN